MNPTLITGVWLSPDRTKLYVQLDEGAVVLLDAQYEDLQDADAVPFGAEALYEPELTGEDA